MGSGIAWKHFGNFKKQKIVLKLVDLTNGKICKSFQPLGVYKIKQ